MGQPASSTFRGETRIDSTRREIDALATAIDAWLAERVRRDPLKQYATQLAFLRDALTGALVAIRGAADAVPMSDAHDRCRAIDTRVALVRRVWGYYRDKFSQRDDPQARPVLAAADEIVWSCYARAFTEAAAHGADAVRGPAPLPFLDAQATPAAILRDEAPRDVRADNDDDVLREYLGRLAVPVIGVPYRCVTDPWMLALLAHEVGHHIELDLGGWELMAAFRIALRDAAGPMWAAWADEIFADACSVFSLGPWGVRALADVEAGDEATLLERGRTRYPAPVVRLALAAALAGDDDHRVLGGLELEALLMGDPLMRGRTDLRAAAEEDLGHLPAVVAAVTSTSIAGNATLPDLFGAPVDPARWVDGLRGRERLYPEQGTDVPREVIAAAVAAWDELAGLADADERKDEQEALAERVLDLVPRTREEGTRAAGPSATLDGRAAADRLAQALLADLDRPEQP
jgi:hypothetical protein